MGLVRFGMRVFGMSCMSCMHNALYRVSSRGPKKRIATNATSGVSQANPSSIGS